MRALRLISTLLCLVWSTAAFAQDPTLPTAPVPTETEGETQAGAGHGEPKSTMEMKDEEFFNQQYLHLMPHPVFVLPLSADEELNQAWFTFYDVNAMQVFALLLMTLVFVPVLRSFGRGRVSAFTRVFRGFVLWIRDEMVYSLMGKEEGERFAPFFLFLFFFLAFLNVVSLVPGSVTANATVFVTGALALITFGIMLVGGMRQQGVVAFWKNLLPHGLPGFLVPLMALVELISLFVKPFALAIRLFGNMLAGHLVMYSFVGLIFVFAKMQGMGVFSWGTAAFSVGLAVFIAIIEAFVALLQAYIFTYLSILFVQQSLHPAH